MGDDVRKVDDLVEYEKLTCRAGIDLSFKLIGLARYLSTDDSWKNDLGEAWSISRLVREELADSGDKDAHGGTDRLLALSYVVDCRVKRGEPLDGQFKRAADHVNQFRDYAFDLQNADGSWHPRFFAYRGQGGTVVDQLYSTGHILRWLVFSLSDDQLQDPRIVRSVALVNRLLGRQPLPEPQSAGRQRAGDRRPDERGSRADALRSSRVPAARRVARGQGRRQGRRPKSSPGEPVAANRATPL